MLQECPPFHSSGAAPLNGCRHTAVHFPHPPPRNFPALHSLIHSPLPSFPPESIHLLFKLFAAFSCSGHSVNYNSCSYGCSLPTSQRDVAISRFYLLLGRYTTHCDQACQSIGWLSLCAFQDALACKAGSTLVTRSLALQKFHDWCTNSQQQFLPFSEPVVYQYCRMLASGAASAPMGALQAIRFAIANCGCLHDCNLLNSCRIAGVCQSRAIARPPKKQADSLTLNAIRILERATCQAAHVYDRLCFGTFLIALYSRARWNDLQHAAPIEVDSPTPEFRYDGSSFISTPTRHFKTSSSFRRKLLLLPITAPIISLSEFRWLDAYFGAREELHLPIRGAIDFPLLPAWDGSDVLTGRALNCRAANKMLFKLLGAYSSVRKLLGYHLDREETSMAETPRASRSENW